MKTSYDAADIPQVQGAKVAILQAEWHREYSDRMVNHCRALLEQAGVDQIQTHVLPGTHELPYGARQVIRATPGLDAVILFGIVVKGETHHFEMIIDSVARGIERVMFEENILVINEVIPATEMSQVEARTGDNESNKGREAAIAAVKMIAWQRGLD